VNDIDHLKGRFPRAYRMREVMKVIGLSETLVLVYEYMSHPRRLIFVQEHQISHGSM
jgi:hypothetical protein